MSEVEKRFEFNLEDQWEASFLSRRLGMDREALIATACGTHPTVGQLVERLAADPFRGLSA